MKPSLVIPALKRLVALQLPAFLWGAPGVGKSDVVRAVARSLKLELKDVRLSLMDPTDLKGFPVPVAGVGKKKGHMAWLQPDFLPTSGKGILFLDEFNHATPALQSASYQLILNRRLGDYELPEGWTVLAAGNRQSDRSNVNAMSAALANRFTHVDYDVDMEDWIDWAIINGVSDNLRGYIRFQPGDLSIDKIDPGMRAFHSPRSWVMADRIMQGSVLDPVAEIGLLEGTIGVGVAKKYIGYLREAKNMPDIDRIAIDPDGVKVPSSPSTCYAVLAALEPRVKVVNFERYMRYVKRMSKEYEVIFATSCVRRDEKISETKVFTDWIRENRSILVG